MASPERYTDAYLLKYRVPALGSYAIAWEAAGLSLPYPANGPEMRAAIAGLSPPYLGNKVLQLGDTSRPADGDKTDGLIPMTGSDGIFVPSCGEGQAVGTFAFHTPIPTDVLLYDAEGDPSWAAQGWNDIGSSIPVPDGPVWDVPAGQWIVVQSSGVTRLPVNDAERFILAHKVNILSAPDPNAGINISYVATDGVDSESVAWDYFGGVPDFWDFYLNQVYTNFVFTTPGVPDNVCGIVSPKNRKDSSEITSREGQKYSSTSAQLALPFPIEEAVIYVQGPIMIEWSAIMLGIATILDT